MVTPPPSLDNGLNLTLKKPLTTTTMGGLALHRELQLKPPVKETNLQRILFLSYGLPWKHLPLDRSRGDSNWIESRKYGKGKDRIFLFFFRRLKRL